MFENFWSNTREAPVVRVESPDPQKERGGLRREELKRKWDRRYILYIRDDTVVAPT